MLHGLSNDFLYSAIRIKATFRDDIANEKSCWGTGFFVQNKKGVVCLVTNRHVVDMSYYRTNDMYKGYNLVSMQISGKRPDKDSSLPVDDQAAEVVDVRHNLLYSQIYENDIACLIKPLIKPITGEGFVAEYAIPYNFIADRERISSELCVCDFVAFPGYPAWYDKLNSRPILRTGTISSDPRFDYSHSGSYDGECVAYEAFSFGGSSGSPIFAVQKGPRPGATISFPGFRELMMIGINAGHLKDENGAHSGISYMYKSSAILTIIDE